MKTIIKIHILLLIGIFTSCSGSDTYRGTWKAKDQNENKFEISFDANTFIIKDTTGSAKSYGYTQNSIQTENFITTYGIKLKDGREYEINFPKSDDETIGLIFDKNGNILYTIGRSDYINYEDIYKL